MKYSFSSSLLLSLFIFILALSGCTSKPPIDRLKEDVQKELAKQEGTFGIAFKDLSTGEQLLINEHENFHAASTMKTPVMIEVFKQAAAGNFSLTDSIEVKNEFKSIVDGSPFSLDVSDDSEEGLYNQVGTKKTIGDLVYDMIIVSSNLATNIVIEKVGAKNVTQTMRDLGASDIQVLRGVEDQKAFDQGLNNTTTPYDLMVIFEKMAKGEAVSPEADQKMITILLDQKFNETIPGKLPKEVKVAHKTGWIRGVRHDSGIVMLPDGRKYVLVILSRDLADDDGAIDNMANASRMIYDYVVSHN